MYKVAGEEKAPETYARILTYIALASVYVSLALTLFAPLLVSTISPPAYARAHRIIPAVAFSYALYGMYFVFTAGLNITKRTYYFPLIVGFAAALNVTLNLVLIPRYGMMAAAWTTFASYLILALLTCLCARRFYRVDYEYGRLIKLAAALLAVLAAGQATIRIAGVWGAAWRLLLLLLFPALLFVLRFFRRGEMEKALELVGLRRAPGKMITKG
jgi:O-antigen/teichoic acid export membrane protein